MTLIVAWKCSDGVVVGADSAATLGAFGRETVKELVTKLYIVKSSLILGVSGPVGLAQRYYSELDNVLALNPQFQQLPRNQALTGISGLLWNHAQVEYQRAGLVAQATNSPAPLLNANHQTVIAVHVAGEDRLIQFTETCAPEEATAEIPYVCIGSGQQNADPFLAFVRHVFWPRSMPNLSGGIFATIWTLRQSIESSPGHVSQPIVIATLKNSQATFLTGHEIEEHLQAISEAEGALHQWRNQLEAQS